MKDFCYTACTYYPYYNFTILANITSRESPIQGDRNGDECSGKLYEASGAGRNTAQRLGKYGRRMDSCAKIEAGARIHVSEGMVKDVTVMKYEENG